MLADTGRGLVDALVAHGLRGGGFAALAGTRLEPTPTPEQDPLARFRVRFVQATATVRPASRGAGDNQATRTQEQLVPTADGARSSLPATQLNAPPTERVLHARRALASTRVGEALTRTVAQMGGIDVAFETLPRGVWGYYRASARGARQIGLSRDLLGATDAAVAAVLAHEMQHVVDLLAMGPVMATEAGCLTTEFNAFSIAALAWQSLDTQLGASARNGHAVEQELDYTLRIQGSDRPEVLRDIMQHYEHRCG